MESGPLQFGGSGSGRWGSRVELGTSYQCPGNRLSMGWSPAARGEASAEIQTAAASAANIATTPVIDLIFIPSTLANEVGSGYRREVLYCVYGLSRLHVNSSYSGLFPPRGCPLRLKLEETINRKEGHEL